MEVYERIRFLRKNTLKMSQEVFAERLGVSRSKLYPQLENPEKVYQIIENKLSN